MDGLSEQITAWWQKEDERCIISGTPADATALAARHTGVMVALEQLGQDIQEAHKQKAYEKLRESTKMLVGLTSEAQVQLSLFDKYGMTVPPEDLLDESEATLDRIEV